VLDDDARDAMLRIAYDYRRLAVRAEVREKEGREL
jgi:hypothetical protein